MADVHSRWINGNLVYYDSTYQRWFDAIGPDVVKILEHFTSIPIASADNPSFGTVTLVEAGAGETTIALVDGSDTGELLITTDAAENDGATLQWKGEAFKLAADKPVYFGARLKISDATQSDFIVGLCITDTTLLGGMSDGVYFRKVDASAAVSAVIEKNTTETTGAAHTMVADTYVILEMVWDGANLDFFVNGSALTRLAQTNIPDDEYLTPSIEFLTGEAVVKTMTVDYVRAILIGS